MLKLGNLDGKLGISTIQIQHTILSSPSNRSHEAANDAAFGEFK
jgi:hypothetical protein